MLKPEETIIEIKNERQLKAVSGITESQLKLIATEFEFVENEDREARSKQTVFQVRKPGGGSKGILKTPLQKVLFVLVYCKSYSTYDDLGSRFFSFPNSVWECLPQRSALRNGVLAPEINGQLIYNYLILIAFA